MATNRGGEQAFAQAPQKTDTISIPKEDIEAIGKMFEGVGDVVGKISEQFTSMGKQEDKQEKQEKKKNKTLSKLFKTIKSAGLGKITEIFSGLLGLLEPLNVVVDLLKGIVDSFVGGVLSELMPAMEPVYEFLAKQMPKAMKYGVIVGKGFIVMVKHIGIGLKWIWEKLKAVNTTLKPFGDFLNNNLINPLRDFFNGIKEFAKTGSFAALTKGFKSLFNGIINMINAVIIKVNDIIPGTDYDIPRIPKLAKGGIVSTNRIVEVAEGNKPEAIVPLDQYNNLLDNSGVEDRLEELIEVTLNSRMRYRGRHY